MSDPKDIPGGVEKLGPLELLRDLQVVTKSLKELLQSGAIKIVIQHNHFYNHVGDVMAEKSNTSTVTVSGSNRGSINVVQDAENVRITAVRFSKVGVRLTACF